MSPFLRVTNDRFYTVMHVIVCKLFLRYKQEYSFGLENQEQIEGRFSFLDWVLILNLKRVVILSHTTYFAHTLYDSQLVFFSYCIKFINITRCSGITMQASTLDYKSGSINETGICIGSLFSSECLRIINVAIKCKMLSSLNENEKRVGITIKQLLSEIDGN